MKTRTLPTLQRREHALASAAVQLGMLHALQPAESFAGTVARVSPGAMHARSPSILQLNVGKRCNQTCRHCHVDAGPDRREVMSDAVLAAALGLLERAAISTLDITGGAPELHPRFREIVERARARGVHVIDRCNLTILRAPNYADLPEFFARHEVEVVASLPWWRDRETDAQRGDGVFEDSIAALRRLNQVGYGVDPSLVLTLVSNPSGAFLPPRQAALERDYRRELDRRYGVQFSRLYTITNMPVSRYLEWLADTGQLQSYMQKLVAAFNPAALEGLMCKSTLSVGWDGRLYDCDFNQMLELSIERDVFDVTLDDLAGREIRSAAHCFGCTAGAGSSCGGATVRT
ncbi:MAG TPA: arsenosugar biosynthesis radical SAM (seleno)protein ArsS [Polyangiales bacterium]|nr:arsenosugar biosynthesis radical SAM (seleno)protein ArsS [Polyangiales bacterium]